MSRSAPAKPFASRELAVSPAERRNAPIIVTTTERASKPNRPNAVRSCRSLCLSSSRCLNSPQNPTMPIPTPTAAIPRPTAATAACPKGCAKSRPITGGLVGAPSATLVHQCAQHRNGAVHPTPMTGAHRQRSGTNRAGTWFLFYRNTGGLHADEIADCRGRPGCICHALTRSRVLHRPRHHYETLHHRRTATHHPNHDYRGSGNGLYHTNGSRRRDEDREGLRKRRNGRWSSCSACSALN